MLYLGAQGDVVNQPETDDNLESEEEFSLSEQEDSDEWFNIGSETETDTTTDTESDGDTTVHPEKYVSYLCAENAYFYAITCLCSTANEFIISE